MKNLFSAILLLIASQASAAYMTPAQLEFSLNQGFGWIPSLGTQVALKKLHVMDCKYDFSLAGGSSAAAINLVDLDGKACVLPDNAIVMSAIIDVITQPTTSNGAKIALGTGQAANDIKTATGVDQYAAGLIAGIPVHTAASAIKMTAERTPQITISTGDLTAGKLHVLFEYLMSE